MTDQTTIDSAQSSAEEKEQQPEEASATVPSEEDASQATSSATSSQLSPAISSDDQFKISEPSPADHPDDVCDEGTLELHIKDGRGNPIQNLELRVLDIGPMNRGVRLPAERKKVFSGKTDSTGRVPAITGLKLGTRFEIQIKKADGEYKLAAIGPMDAKETIACLKSPKVRFEFNTYSHQGSEGTAEKLKKKIIESHNQTAEVKANISRNPDAKPTIQNDRDKSGNPKVIINDGLPNMYGQNTYQTLVDHKGKSDLDKVKELIEFGMEQAAWRHPKNLTSSTIISQMKAGKYKITPTENANGYKNSRGDCTKHVKIALWKAGYSHNDGDVASTVSPAKNMGPALVNAGFTDITSQIPDARWAAPGDIIVYERMAAPNEAGHIDIRTYDGYLSDFFETYLPVTQYRVTGIYRKYYDPLPELRMRAFLKVIRSREAETVMKNYGDAATYRALPLSAKMGLMFDGFDTHPFDGKEARSTASGAYGTLHSTWRQYTDPAKNPKPWVPLRNNAPKFSPIVQDRIAVAIMELHSGVGYRANKGVTALGLIRKGDIERAATLLATIKPYQWTSLPGGTESNYSSSSMMKDYENYLSELSRK